MSSGISRKILLVDDDQALLDAMRRTHRRAYDLHVACGGEAALELMEQLGPFAVVVSDYQMPGMDGIQFLGKVQELQPETVRVMLTGNADLQSAIEAVNQGHVFRFLTKPCDRETFSSCLESALEQYSLRHAERDLLDRTVRGSIEVLAEVLSLASPQAFGRSTRVQAYVKQLVARLKLTPTWQYETAALLSQIGFVSIPAEAIDLLAANQPVGADYQEMIDRHPGVARELLCKIPRLDQVAEMIAHQAHRSADVKESGLEHGTALGSQILAAALAFDELISGGVERQAAIRSMAEDRGRYAPRLLSLLSEVQLPGQDRIARTVPIRSLLVGMILDQDLHAHSGTLIVAKGNAISGSMLQRLRNYGDSGGLPERVRVRDGDTERGETTAA